MSFEKKPVHELGSLNNSKQLGNQKTRSNNMYVRKVEKLYTEPNQMKRKFSIKNTKMGNRTMKQKQELYEENIHLKNINKELSREINLQKAYTLHEKKKNKLFKNKLGRQFEKQFYYSVFNANNENSGHNYLIAGVKCQYEKLKSEHEILNEKYESLLHSDHVKKYQQYKIYNEVLENQNKRLKEMLQAVYKIKNKDALNEIKQEDLRIELGLLKHREEELIIKNKRVKEELNRIRKQKKEKDRKIVFLQKLILSKDNKEHMNIVKYQKYEKERQILQKQIQQKSNSLKRISDQQNVQIQEIKDKYDAYSNKEQQVYQGIIKQKNDKIKELQKQIKYLNTVLSYWRTEEGEQKQTQSKPEHQQHTIIKQIHIEIPSQFNQHQRSSNDLEQPIEKSLRQSSRPKIKRIRKTGSQKNTQNAKKLRKVNLNDLTGVSQFLKFRLIGLNIENDVAKQFIEPSTLMQDQWERQYINFAEMNTILKKHPFNLSEDDAFNLGRYIIEEDSQFQISPHNTFVYFDEENQISRRVAQSILKAFIGEFHLPHHQLCQKQWEKIIKENGGNLILALNSIGKNGLISQEKWSELIKDINIQVSQNVENWCIGKMLLQSRDLDHLSYQVLVK